MPFSPATNWGENIFELFGPFSTSSLPTKWRDIFKGWILRIIVICHIVRYMITAPQIHNRRREKGGREGGSNEKIIARCIGKYPSEWGYCPHKKRVAGARNTLCSWKYERTPTRDWRANSVLCSRQSAMDFWCGVSKVPLRYFWQK